MTTSVGPDPDTMRCDGFRVTVAGSDTSFVVAPGERILAGARRAGVWLPYECGWGGCGTCKVTVLEGTTELVVPQVPCVDPRDERRRRVVVCQSTPTSDLVVRTTRVDDAPSPERPTTDHVARLDRREEVGPDVVRLRFTLDRVATFRPGQHAVLEVAPGLRRCYSMAGLPGTREVDFVVKRYAGRPGSEALFGLAAGTELHAELPYGDMWLRDGTRPVVLVAGGSGVSAICALVKQLAGRARAGRTAAGPSRPVRVHYGAATRADLVCWDELAEDVAALPDGRLHGALVSPGPGWDGTTGFVTQSLATALPDLGDADFYVAGPPVMTDAVRDLLRENGVQLDRVFYDSFG